MLKKIIIITSIVIFQFLSKSFAMGSFYLGPAASFYNIVSSQMSYTGISPAFYLGYGSWMNDYFYLAFEGFASLEPHDISGHNSSLLKTRYVNGLSLVPAVYLYHNLIGYGRIGYVRANFKNLNEADSTYQIGFGLEMPTVSCWSVRLEYDYSPFKHIRNTFNIDNVHINQVTLALIYRFESILGPIS